jgi:hypothetical protein
MEQEEGSETESVELFTFLLQKTEVSVKYQKYLYRTHNLSTEEDTGLGH